MNRIKIARDIRIFWWNYFPNEAPSSILILFLVLNERKFLFSSANVTFNEALIETLNAYLNAHLNERPHEEGVIYALKVPCHLQKSPILSYGTKFIHRGRVIFSCHRSTKEVLQWIISPKGNYNDPFVDLLPLDRTAKGLKVKTLHIATFCQNFIHWIRSDILQKKFFFESFYLGHITIILLSTCSH